MPLASVYQMNDNNKERKEHVPKVAWTSTNDLIETKHLSMPGSPVLPANTWRFQQRMCLQDHINPYNTKYIHNIFVFFIYVSTYETTNVISRYKTFCNNDFVDV